MVHKPGSHEIPKGILAGRYVKPFVHTIQYLGQPALSFFPYLFDCDSPLITPTVRVLTNIYDDSKEPLARFRAVPIMSIPLVNVMLTIIPGIEKRLPRVHLDPGNPSTFMVEAVIRTSFAFVDQISPADPRTRGSNPETPMPEGNKSGKGN